MSKVLRIRRGDTRIPIFRSGPGWEVRPKGQRKWFAQKTRAITYAETVATRTENGSRAWLGKTGEHALQHDHLLASAARQGITPDQLLDESDGRWELKHKLISAARGLRIAELVDKFIAAAETRGLDDYTVRDYRVRLKRFAGAFNCSLAEVHGRNLSDWLDSLPALSNKGQPLKRIIGPRTRNNYRAAITELAAWARDQKFLPADWNELAAVARLKTSNRKLIFTPEEMRLLLEAAKEKLVPALVLGAFAGLRTEEIQDLTWHDIDWEEKIIRVRVGITKNEKGRNVPMIDPLLDWLLPWRLKTGPVNEYANLSNQKYRLARQVGLSWRHNALRHSFGTYRLALTRSAAQVSLEMGNNPKDLENSYARPRTARNAADWFAIRPGNVSTNVLPLDFSAKTGSG